MTYLSFKVEFQNLHDFTSLVTPIDIFSSFIEALGDNTTGSNFNKYYDPQRGIIHPQIEVRANVQNETKAREVILRVARNLKEQNRIRHYEEQLRPWIEPLFVVKAHELGAVCIIEFKDQLLKTPKLLKAFETDRGNFLFEFVYVLLGQLEFRPFITWSIKRNFPIPESDLIQIASSCARLYHKQTQDFELPDFLERFIHSFLNCAGQEAESIFLNAIVSSQPYKVIVDSAATKTFGE